jgi:hypothetical protein
MERTYDRYEVECSWLEAITGHGSLGYMGTPSSPNDYQLRIMHFYVGNLRTAAYGVAFQVQLIEFLQNSHCKFLGLVNSTTPQDPQNHDLTEEYESLRMVMAQQSIHYRQLVMARAQAQLDSVRLLSSLSPLNHK